MFKIIKNIKKQKRKELEADQDNLYELYFLARKYRTELYELSVKDHSWNLKYVPIELRTPELCKVALENDELAFRWIPNHLKTIPMCLDVVTKNVFMFKYVPDEFKTLEICNIAVKQNGMALGYVPVPLRVEDLCLEALKTTDLFPGVLEHVPEHLKTEKMCWVAINQNISELQYVPKELITEDMIAKLIKMEDSSLLHYLPEEFITLQMCEMAVEKHSSYCNGSLEDIKCFIENTIPIKYWEDLKKKYLYKEEMLDGK